MENFVFSWVWSDMSNQTQTYQHLPEVFFGNPKGITKDWLIYNGIGKIFASMHLAEINVPGQNTFVPSQCRFLDH